MCKAVTISVRVAVRDDWLDVLHIHRRAIHEIAITDYPVDVLNAWGPPILDGESSRMLAEFDAKHESGHVILVAEANGSLAGFGEMVPERNELLAIYVNPDYRRQGVGSMLLRELEHIAREMKLYHLEMDSSVTAAPFYKALGFKSLGRGVHILNSGNQMDCVRMRKIMT